MSTPTRFLPRQTLGYLTGVILCSLAQGAVYAADTLATITDPSAVWELPTGQRGLPHPIHFEGRVAYFDPGFKLFWFEHDDTGSYLQLSTNPPPMKVGQQVVIEGTIVPTEGLDARSARVRVISDYKPITPLETKGHIDDAAKWNSRTVTAEGYVDSQLLVDADHVRMIVIVENRPVICWVKPDNPDKIPTWLGRVVRMTGLYSSRFDPTRTTTTVEFWLGRQDGLEIVGALEDLPAFKQPVTPIDQLYGAPPSSTVRVRGVVERHKIGASMTLRDTTGQVEVRSIQQERAPLGSVVEAVGKIAFSNGQVSVVDALYRAAPAAALVSPVPSTSSSDTALATVDEVRALGAEQAAQARPVALRGMVTWSLPESDFFFLQDFTGGIRVYYDRTKTGDVRYGKYFAVKGVTRAERVVPSIEMRDYTDLGSMSHPTPPTITLEQAMTGSEDGKWVELRGFVRDIVSEGDWRWIHVATPAGYFTGHLQNPVNFVANPGSLIRMHGVCETNFDATGRVSGITLRVPFLHDITIEEDAPADYYDLPRHSLGDLERISASQEMQRVRITGMVQYAIPGQSVYLQEDNTGLLLLSHETQPLNPGDQVEAVGILGREGARTVLRETVFRRTGTGPAPQPLVLSSAQSLVPRADSQLVRVRGTLIESFKRAGRTRLTLQDNDTLFEAVLDQPASAPPLKVTVGAGLELTGIYKLVYDDSRQSRGFQILLRNPDDVTVFAAAKLWTVQLALTVAGILGGCVFLGLIWIRVLRQRVQQQTAQIREQMQQQARLEGEVHRAARLASLGSLAGGIAHDYNNLLTIIMGNLSFMKFNPLVMGTEGERIRDIEQGAIRARDLTRQLLTFAEGGDPLRKAVDLLAIVRATAERVMHGTNVRCVYEIATDLKPAHVDPEQITQVVQNLLLNAVQAMTSGGSVRIVLSNVESPSGSLTLAPGTYVKLAVIDNGGGIPPEALPRIFDPFFTTKKGNGGLGLATAYSVIKKHGGHIEAHSQVGQGTTFTVWLPGSDSSETSASYAVAETVPAPPPAPGAPPARVLLMDDEDSIRRLGAMLLHRLGLEAITVPDGVAALSEIEKAKQSGHPFSLLILDLTIPHGMGGKDTIAAIRQTDPHTPAIVCSGYSRDPVLANFVNFGFQAMITKPYEIGKMTDAIRRFLPAITKPG